MKLYCFHYYFWFCWKSVLYPFNPPPSPPPPSAYFSSGFVIEIIISKAVDLYTNFLGIFCGELYNSIWFWEKGNNSVLTFFIGGRLRHGGVDRKFVCWYDRQSETECNICFSACTDVVLHSMFILCVCLQLNMLAKLIFDFLKNIFFFKKFIITRRRAWG